MVLSIFGGRFYAINPDGTVKWEYMAQNGETVSSPAVIGSDGTIYFGGLVGFSGGLIALNTDGTVKWEYYIGNGIESPPAIGPDGTIYFGCSDGYFYAVQGSGQLANTPWPKFRHDSKNSGRVGGP